MPDTTCGNTIDFFDDGREYTCDRGTRTPRSPRLPRYVRTPLLERRMTACVLYIAIEAPTVSDAQSQLRRFIDAGLNTDSPSVHVAIGEPDTLHQRPPKATT